MIDSKKNSTIFVRKMTRASIAERIKLLLWPVLFWGWIAGVSIWLEETAIPELPPGTTSQRLSNIQFSGMNFEQLYADGSTISLKASRADFDSDNHQMIFGHPTISQTDKSGALIFSASGNTGTFETTKSTSSLPSEFPFLVLKGDVHLHVHAKNSRVDSNLMLFDNENRLFIFPESFQFTGPSFKGTLKTMYFNPDILKGMPLQNLLDQRPELKQRLSELR